MSEEDAILYDLSRWGKMEISSDDSEYALLERLVREGYVAKEAGGHDADGTSFSVYRLSDRELSRLGRL